MKMTKKMTFPLLGVALLAVTFLLLLDHGKSPIEATPTDPKLSHPVKDRIKAEGWVTTYPGAEVVVSTDRPGTIARLLVEEKSVVKKGDLLLEIRADEERAALAEVRAKLQEATADAEYFRKESARAKSLVDSKTISADTYERTKRDQDSAQARVRLARAGIARLEAILAKTRITAPIDGTVVLRYVHPGETLEPRAPILKLVDLHRIRIDAEVDEFDSSRVKLGSKATITVEGYANQSWAGTVEEIPDLVQKRRLNPQDPGRPSDTQVLVVKVALDAPTPLKLGQRVEVEMAQP